MSCYLGLWVVFKCVIDVVELLVLVDIDLYCIEIVLLIDFILLEGGLNICWFDLLFVQEVWLFDYKWYVVFVYVWVNKFDWIEIDLLNVCFGIMIGGKVYFDVCQVLIDFGFDDEICVWIGIWFYKVGCVWLFEVQGVQVFVCGFDEILVVEEKCQIFEYVIKEELYNWFDV